jgi:hypothetical protein
LATVAIVGARRVVRLALCHWQRARRLEFGLPIVSWKSVRTVIDTEILKREFAFAIVKGAAATKTGQWLIMCRRGFNPDDSVFCSAVGAMEGCRECHAALIAFSSWVLNALTLKFFC